MKSPIESKLFDTTIGKIWPGARAAAWLNIEMCEEVFAIKFKNGDSFQGPKVREVFQRAQTHADVVKRLTGKYP